MNDKELIHLLANALSKRMVWPPPTKQELDLLWEAEKELAFCESPTGPAPIS